ncbi:hypothetical protein SteCoe_133 [Stentor coeruleus]|uniref:Uncharacterized protein n=1 Tax=Stentor coeruleus TaxID=5963 RepID=A0A1R2D541_9CILI|nr:hypothetical protein SteCoe_133 [Stentor coeruleus]
MIIWGLLTLNIITNSLAKSVVHKKELQQEPLAAPIIKTEFIAFFSWLTEDLISLSLILLFFSTILIVKSLVYSKSMYSSDHIYLNQQRDTPIPQYCL